MTSAHRVVLATNNRKKLAELRRLVVDETPDVQVLGLVDVPEYPEPVETERTFEGNALLKARACVAASGLPALADDSVDRNSGYPNDLGHDQTAIGALMPGWGSYPPIAMSSKPNSSIELTPVLSSSFGRARGSRPNCRRA